MVKSLAWPEVSKLWLLRLVNGDGSKERESLAKMNLEYFIDQSATGKLETDDQGQMFADLVATYVGTIRARAASVQGFYDAAKAELSKRP